MDIEWLLTYDQILQRTNDIIIRVLELLSCEASHKYCIESAFHIEEFLKKYPEEKEKLVEAVQKGRIEIVCGGYTSTCNNIPQGEFLVRNYGYMKNLARHIFNYVPNVGWNVDEFGHNPQLPQILKKLGIDFYVFSRGVPHKIPEDFKWRGIDGTEIVAHWNSQSYTVLHPLPEDIVSAFHMITSKVNLVKENSPTPNVLLINSADWSLPQPHLPRIVNEWKKVKGGEIELEIATPSEYFDAITKHIDKLPILSEDFNGFAPGVLSSRIEVKKKNREVENLYLAAERFNAISSILGYEDSSEDLMKALKLILANHHHDPMHGGHTDPVYDNTIERFRDAQELSKEVLTRSLHYLASLINTENVGVKKTALIVFNPLGWRRRDIVSVEMAFGGEEIRSIRLLNNENKEIPFQLAEVERDGNGNLRKATVIFEAETPSLGYSVYYVYPSTEEKTFDTNLKVERNGYAYCIENNYYRILTDQYAGSIKSIYDKKNDVEILDTTRYYGNTIFDEEEKGSLFNFDGDCDGFLFVTPFKNLPSEKANNTSQMFSFPTITEYGPIKLTVMRRSLLGDSLVIQYVTIYNSIPRIDFKTIIDFRGKYRRLRLLFPINLKNGTITYGIPFGAVKRNEGEYPSTNWIDYSGDTWGVSLLNKGLPGNSVVKNNMMITLLRSTDRISALEDYRVNIYWSGRFGPGYQQHSDPAFFGFENISRTLVEPWMKEIGKRPGVYSGEKALENGEHIFDYSLLPHKGTWRDAKTYKVGLEFNNPLILIKTDIHKGKLPKRYSFISINPENLVLTAFLKDGDHYLIRFYEAEGKTTEGSIELFKPIDEAYNANLLGEPEKKLDVKERTIKVNVGKFEIVTLKVRLKK